LFGLNVALTEKFESNSQPMKIHISEPCKALLTPQYKTEERTDNPELASKVVINTDILT
jgi:Adenylate and Guanylate cyclase catalytic domain